MAMIIQKVFICVRACVRVCMCVFVCVCVCVCKTRMFSVKLNVCICVSMSELKREDRLVLTYKCMCMYMRVSWYVFDHYSNRSAY